MAKVNWTTEALATLRFRDRYSHETILKDFSDTATAAKVPELQKSAQKLTGTEDLFATPVVGGRYKVVWRTDDDQVQVVAIAQSNIRSKADLDIQIEAEAWPWESKAAR